MRSEIHSRQNRRHQLRWYIFRRWWVPLFTILIFLGGAIIEGIFGNLGSDIFRAAE